MTFNLIGVFCLVRPYNKSDQLVGKHHVTDDLSGASSFRILGLLFINLNFNQVVVFILPADISGVLTIGGLHVCQEKGFTFKRQSEFNSIKTVFHFICGFADFEVE